MEKVSATILHLDTPKAVPVYTEFEVKGWVVSAGPVLRVYAERPGEKMEMAFVDRPDVQAAFPQHAYAKGFVGSLTTDFVIEGRVRFRVATPGGLLDYTLPLGAPLFAPHGPPPDEAITPEVKAEKLDKIRPHLACPVCKSPLDGHTPGCGKCGAEFRFTPSILDLLTPEQRASVPGVNDTGESHGGIDEVMFSIIHQFRDGLILDCGAGFKHRVYRNVINLEIMDYASTDVRAFNESLPFRDATFDAVFTLATLEHVRDPFTSAKEILRVLKPGGLLYSMIPLMVPFHGYPNHYYNMTIEGHKNLYGAGIELLDTSVPLSGRPLWGLSGMIKSWAAGLPAAHREEFLNLTLRDFVGDPHDHLRRNYVRFLSPEANVEIAAMTRIIGRRR